MTQTRNKNYLEAATKGNGSQSLDVNYGRISMTPQPSNSGQEDLESNRPNSAPSSTNAGNATSANTASSAPTSAFANNAAQQHFASSQQPPASALKTPASSKAINLPPQNQQSSQATSHSTSASRVNRGAQRRPVLATLGPSQGDSVINYNSSEGQKTYKRASSSLKDEYDGKSEGITVFRMQIGQRSQNEGWANGTGGDCVHIPMNGIDPSSGVANVIDERTQISEASIMTWASRELVKQSISPLHINRKAQNNRNMVQTIMNTMTKDCLTKVSLKKDRYTVSGVVIAALLYKIVMEGAELETMVTSANIRQGLQESKAKLASYDGNIGEYVDFVRASLQKLHARGETTNEQDLIIAIFCAFTSTVDADFSTHFKKEELLWLSNMKPYTIEILLSHAEVMYKVKADHGDWGNKTREEQELIAMKAEFKDLNLKFSEERKKNKKLRQSQPNSNSSGGGSGRRGLRIRPGEEWKFENPDNKKKLQREGKTWYWCLNHNEGRGMWTIHKPADCRRARQSSNSSSSGTTPATSGGDQAMPAVQEEDSDSESQPDSEADY